LKVLISIITNPDERLAQSLVPQSETPRALHLSLVLVDNGFVGSQSQFLAALSEMEQNRNLGPGYL
jgi:hypothetical protein